MQASKIYIFRNPEGMWECGVITTVGEEEVYMQKHESSTWEELTNWVKLNYVH